MDPRIPAVMTIGGRMASQNPVGLVLDVVLHTCFFLILNVYGFVLWNMFIAICKYKDLYLKGGVGCEGWFGMWWCSNDTLYVGT